MKIKNLLLLTAAASLSISAFAQQTEGELAFQNDGVTPAMVGQATNDHFFVRETYADVAEGTQYDNVVSFKGGSPQVVWFWLDDDEIYQNEAVQALTPIAYNSAGDLYNEITYNSFQCDLYLPESVQMIIGEDEDGNEVYCEKGDRLPNTSTFTFGEKDRKVVDGITYRVYTLIMYNDKAFGSHFSARNASKYAANGALKKDDAALFGIYLQNDNQETVEGELDNMIIANTLLNFREGDVAGWDVNEKQFFYGTGGNNETQRFMKYNRVQLFGSNDVVETLGEKEIKSVEYFNVAGMQSNEPFEGVNIKVVTFNDGTTSTSKVIK